MSRSPVEGSNSPELACAEPSMEPFIGQDQASLQHDMGRHRQYSPDGGVYSPLSFVSPPSIMQAKSDASRSNMPLISNDGLVLPKTEATARRPIASSSHLRVQSARGLNAAIGGPPHAMIGIEAAFQRKDRMPSCNPAAG